MVETIGRTYAADGDESWRIEVTDETFVPMGDRYAHRQVKLTHPGGEQQPSYEYVVEVWDGVPVFTSIRYTAKPDARVSIRTKDLLPVKLEDLIPWIYGIVGTAEKTPTGFVSTWGSAELELRDRNAADRGRRQVRSRRVVDLRRVAEVYNNAAGDRAEAVAVAFDVHRTTVFRWLRRIRNDENLKELLNG